MGKLFGTSIFINSLFLPKNPFFISRLYFKNGQIFKSLCGSILLKQNRHFSQQKRCSAGNIQLIIKSISKENHFKANKDRNKIVKWRWDIISAVLVFFGVFEEEPKDSPLIINIKKGILAKQRKEYHKAELLLHTALKMAQDLSYTEAEMYIFDVMADNYFEKGDYSKALNLYLEVLSYLSKKEDFSSSSEELVEISIKLAYCYDHINQLDLAEKGFLFSIDTQLLRTNSFWNDKKCQLLINDNLNNVQKNSLALLGMAYDYYSKHLEQWSSKLLDRALKYRLKAFEISKIVNGNDHSQTLVLENNIADLYTRLKKYDLAQNHLLNVINKAKATESSELAAFLLNLASVYFQQNRNDLGQNLCSQAYEFLLKNKKRFKPAKNHNELTEKDRQDLLKKVEYCLNGDEFY